MVRCPARRIGTCLCLVLFARFAVLRADTIAPSGAQPEAVRIVTDLVVKGQFDQASEALKTSQDAGADVERLRTWLDEFQTGQESRRLADLAEFEKYVEFAKARIERQEYMEALRWTWRAADNATDRGAFLASDWVHQLVNDSLTSAEELRRDRNWEGAWKYYAQLEALFENEAQYERLLREVLTHLRLDTMFEKGRHWQERIDKVRWTDAEEALELIEANYVEPPDFKAMAESGLEQLLFLAQSKTAREALEGLKDEETRKDFENRVRARLEQVRAAPRLDRGEAVAHFRRVVKDINKETVNLPEELIVSELIRGAFEPLDDFTNIIWPEESDEFEKHTRGDFTGVGISIIKNKLDEIEVVTPLEDTPAFHAGIQAGDIIAKVNGLPIKEFSLTKVVSTITGPKGSEVTLTIRRDTKEIEFPLRREVIKIRSVKGWDRDPNVKERWNHWLDEENKIGYIRLTNFQRNTTEDLVNVMSELEAEGLRGLVLDVRWNPGGLLDTAWQVASLFLKRADVVVSTRGRNRAEDQMLPAPTNGPYAKVPLVVLVDENSASASEIVSGALRDNQRATVVGARTFGKFSVQNLVALGRSKAKLKLTTARYYLPNGQSLHKEPNARTWGVEPNVPIRLTFQESRNAYQLRRDAELLGPAAKKPENEDPVDEIGDEPEGDRIEKPGDVVDAEKPKESVEGETLGPKLPPLIQKDDNNRPKADPQRDAALLVIRAKLMLNDAQRRLAAAPAEPKKEASP